MHGRVHPDKCRATDLLVVDFHPSLAYFMMILPIYVFISITFISRCSLAPFPDPFMLV